MKYYSYMNEMLDKMRLRYEENYYEKQDSWRKMSSAELKELFFAKYEKFLTVQDGSKEDQKIIVDMCNLLLMAGQRQSEESKN